VSYSRKHNEANGEENRDGTDQNLSWNCGVEGPTDDPDVRALRARQKRNLLATLLFSQGVPMILGGDELGRTQRGNNNAYCQDNEISWYDWDLDEEDRAFLAFARQVIALRRAHPALRRRRFFSGREIRGADVKDVQWLRPDGREMGEDDWADGCFATLAVFLAGDALGEVDPATRAPVRDDDLLLMLNGN